MDKFEKWLNKTLMPLASKMNKNHFISALSEAFMRCMPLTLGIALLTIIGYFPVPAWVDFLNSIGLAQHFSAVIGAVTSALAIYVTYNFAMRTRMETNLCQEDCQSSLLLAGVCGV